MNFFENIKEYIYRKRFIQPWPFLETLAEASYVINPKFIVVDDLIFLDCDNEDLCNINSDRMNESEKIQTEALENHVHLFDGDGIKKQYQKDVKTISIAIAENLLKCLKFEFPNKKFVVLLELNFQDSVIVRFHQIRDNEDLYFDPKYCADEYENGKFMIFR